MHVIMYTIQNPIKCSSEINLHYNYIDAFDILIFELLQKKTEKN